MEASTRLPIGAFASIWTPRRLPVHPGERFIAPVQLSLDIAAGAETVLVLDLTVIDFSDHPPRGYELSLKGYELYSNGKLIDKIPPG